MVQIRLLVAPTVDGSVATDNASSARTFTGVKTCDVLSAANESSSSLETDARLVTSPTVEGSMLIRATPPVPAGSAPKSHVTSDPLLVQAALMDEAPMNVTPPGNKSVNTTCAAAAGPRFETASV